MRRKRWIVLAVLVLAAAGIGLALASGGGVSEPTRPPLRILRGPAREVRATLRPLERRVARRVERIRGIGFRRLPSLALMGPGRLASLDRRYARLERQRAVATPALLHRRHRLERASVEFDQVAGLLPPEFSLGPDTKGGPDRIAGAFDYRRDRIILVRRTIQDRIQLDDTLAHELTHALENQHFDLHLRALARPGEAAAVHRAVIEGSAMLVQFRYQHRYLHDDVAVGTRIEGSRSLIAVDPGAYAINAQAIFDYVDGALFVRQLYRRARGWSLVDRALRAPPRRSREILHPRSWPGAGSADPVRLGIAGVLRGQWRRVGGGSAGEEQALVILLAGAPDIEAQAGASGWEGGRFAVWRPRSAHRDCAPHCVAGDVGVVAFRWQHRDDASQFALAVPAYATLGLYAEVLTHRIWRIGSGYLAVGTAPRGSALAFAPRRRLADSLSRLSARRASAYDVRDKAGDGPRSSPEREDRAH